VDLLLTPVLTGGCPTLAEMAGLGPESDSIGQLVRFTVPFNMSGQPALVLPVGLSDAALPVAVQLVARRFEEPLLLRAGQLVERRTSGFCRHPPL